VIHAALAVNKYSDTETGNKKASSFDELALQSRQLILGRDRLSNS